MIGSILITGGAGYFGRHFVKRLLRDNLSERICIYSRDEAKHAAMREQFDNDERLRFFIGCVRDLPRLKRAMGLGQNLRVDIVVHAAALKRIEVGRYDAEEFVKTNVDGSINVIEACRNAYVKQAVLLSSDKAVAACSPYGLTKALAEWLFLSANDSSGFPAPIFTAVRYGNVMGSTGSVVQTWRERLRKRLPLKMTEPGVTRYWMHVDEAIDLVLRAIDRRRPELLLPEVLPAFALVDLAVAMGGGSSVPIEITGLPDFEKKHESLALGYSSEHVRRMSVEELREALTHVE